MPDLAIESIHISLLGDIEDQETAEQVSTFKSALYTIVRPLQLGASIDGPADPELLTLLERFGRPLGRAFQLKDDLLGVLGDEAAIGKPVGDDLREGKPTDMNVYDGVALSVVSELSERSVAEGATPQEFPDFTRGMWQSYPPLGMLES